MESAAAKQILIVDDEPTARHLLRYVLQIGGYRLLIAHDVFEALKLFDEGERPDLVVCDVMLPGMLGTDLVQHMAEVEELRHVPVVLLSAYHDVSRIGKTAAFVYKPYTPDALLALVAELLADPNPPPNAMRTPSMLSM